MHHQKNHYTFTWRRNSDHLRDALKEMMTSSEFTDVTLVTDDKQLIRAHRNILGACSPVFKNILQLEINSANPVIYLRGIQHSEIESILQFIYLGEARIYKERMSEFLIVSKNLEIMELSTGINYQTDSNEKIDEYENYIADAENIDEKPAPTFNGDDYLAKLSLSMRKFTCGTRVQPKQSKGNAYLQLLAQFRPEATASP